LAIGSRSILQFLNNVDPETRCNHRLSEKRVKQGEVGISILFLAAVKRLFGLFHEGLGYSRLKIGAGTKKQENIHCFDLSRFRYASKAFIKTLHFTTPEDILSTFVVRTNKNPKSAGI